MYTYISLYMYVYIYIYIYIHIYMLCIYIYIYILSDPELIADLRDAENAVRDHLVWTIGMGSALMGSLHCSCFLTGTFWALP